MPNSVGLAIVCSNHCPSYKYAPMFIFFFFKCVKISSQKRRQLSPLGLKEQTGAGNFWDFWDLAPSPLTSTKGPLVEARQQAKRTEMNFGSQW